MTAEAMTGYRVIRARARRRRAPLALWYRHNQGALLGVAGLVTFFVLWQVGAAAGLIDPFFFSTPVAVAQAAFAEVQVPRFWSDVQYSVTEVVVGFVAAFVLAVPLGIAIGWYRRVSYTFDPWLNFLNAIPRPALIPLVVLWVGLGIEMKIIIVFLGGFFSIVLPTVEGVRTVEQSLLDVAHSSGLWHVSSDPISKFELLRMLDRAFGTGTRIERDETFRCDRSLDSSRFWTETGLGRPTWGDMIAELREDPTPYEELHRAAARA